MAKGHYMPYLFYNKVSPQEFLERSEFNELAQASGVKVKSFDKIIFNMPQDCPFAGKIDTLHVCFGYLVPQKATLVDVIFFKDGQPAIFFVEFGKEQVDLPKRLEYSSDVDVRFKDGILPENYESFWPINE